MPLPSLPNPRDLLPGRQPEARPAKRDLLPDFPAPMRAARDREEGKLAENTGIPHKDEVWKDRTGLSQEKAGKSFPWPRAGPLAMLVENTQDQAVTIDIHGGVSDDNSRKLASPLRSITLGSNQRQLLNMNPAAGDNWAPYVWPVAYSNAIPQTGELRVVFSRPGI